MPEKVNPAISIMLDRERHLKFTLGAIIRFKEATGKDLRKKEVAAAIQKDLDLEDLRAIIWACLAHEDKELTLEAVGDLIDLSNMSEISAKFNEALKIAIPAPPKGPALSQSKGGSEASPPFRKKSRTG
jgi:hypothetical protein